MDGIRIEMAYSPVINFSLQQNHVPVIKSLILYNETTEDMQDLVLQITAEPAFVIPFEKPLVLLPAGQGADVGFVDLKISPDFLVNLSERFSGLLTVSLFKDGMLLHSQVFSLDMLTYETVERAGLYAGDDRSLCDPES